MSKREQVPSIVWPSQQKSKTDDDAIDWPSNRHTPIDNAEICWPSQTTKVDTETPGGIVWPSQNQQKKKPDNEDIAAIAWPSADQKKKLKSKVYTKATPKKMTERPTFYLNNENETLGSASKAVKFEEKANDIELVRAHVPQASLPKVRLPARKSQLVEPSVYFDETRSEPKIVQPSQQ